MTANPDLVRTVIAKLAAELFDRNVMSNLTRPVYVERLVEQGLLPAWQHVGSDWAGWDLESDAGVRLEVKQSAVRQTWTDGPTRLGKPTQAIFDIAPRTGYYADGGSRWVSGICRPADIYVFAHHPVFDLQEVDQRDPAQWVFYVVSERRLPETRRTLRLPWLKTDTRPVGYAALKEAVTAVAASLTKRKRDELVSSSK